MQWKRFLYLCATVCLYCACTENRTAGPSTEEGNPQIVAVVVNGDNRPVAGALVVAYLTPVNSDSSVQPGSAIRADSSHTDPHGSCLFEGLDPGRYSVVASDSAGSSSAMRSDIILTVKAPKTPEFSDTLVLAAAGGIRGMVTRNGVQSVSNQNLKDGGIQIKIGEIDRSYLTGPDGSYSFANLPAGPYTLYFYANDFYSAKRANIVVAAGVAATVDTVILTPWPYLLLVPPRGLRVAYDTSVGIVALNWQRVRYDSLRWYKVQRVDLSSSRETDFICADTAFTDTLAGIPKGTILDYSVCSAGMIDQTLSQSAGTAPVEITVAR